jgi:hypothetical protein
VPSPASPFSPVSSAAPETCAAIAGCGIAIPGIAIFGIGIPGIGIAPIDTCWIGGNWFIIAIGFIAIGFIMGDIAGTCWNPTIAGPIGVMTVTGTVCIGDIPCRPAIDIPADIKGDIPPKAAFIAGVGIIMPCGVCCGNLCPAGAGGNNIIRGVLPVRQRIKPQLLWSGGMVNNIIPFGRIWACVPIPCPCACPPIWKVE